MKNNSSGRDPLPDLDDLLAAAPRTSDEGSAPLARLGASNLIRLVPGHLVKTLILALSALVISRVMGPRQYGVYAAVLAVITIGQAVSSAGLLQVENRWLAPLWNTDRSAALRLGSAIWTVQLILATASAVAASAAIWRTTSLGLGVATCFAIGIVGLARNTLEATRGFFLCIGQAGRMMTVELVRALIVLPVVAIAFRVFGLAGVYWALGLAYLVLLAFTTRALFRVFPVQFSLAGCSDLRPFLGYSIGGFVAVVAAVSQVQFGVYAVATWVTPAEAAFLSIATMLSSLVAGLFMAGRRSLMPVLGNLAAVRDEARLHSWADAFIRYSVAATCLVAIGWAFLGRHVLSWLLTGEYSSVFGPATVLLVAAVVFPFAATCRGLLFTRRLAGVVAWNNVIHATVTCVGLLIAIQGPASGVSFRVAIAYAVGSAISVLCGYFSVGLFGGIWLPLGRVVALASPVVAAGVAAQWQPALLPALAATATAMVLYTMAAIGFRLLPFAEIRSILRVLHR